MPIQASVGIRGANRGSDVNAVQILLNANLARIGSEEPVWEDGVYGDQTRDRIGDFQSNVLEMRRPDKRVDPGGRTLKAMLDGLEPGYTLDRTRTEFIHATLDRVRLFYEGLKRGMTDNGIDTPLRIVHFLAQIGHESGCLRYTEEIASGRAYEGRRDLGNTKPGDGVRFKGRGLIQLTGRFNYSKFGDFLGRDLTSDAGAESVATDPELAVLAAVWYWNDRNINPLADADDIKAVTRRVNGGLNGLSDRKHYYDRAKQLFAT